MFQRLICWLYQHYGKPDLVGVTRKQMQSLGAEVELASLSHEQQQEYCSEADLIMKGETFGYVHDELIRQLINQIAMEAATFESVLFNRATINGIELYHERMQALASMKEQYEEMENPHEVP